MTQRSARNDIARVFRAAARLVQNAAIERLAKKDAGVSCSENKKMGNSSTEDAGGFLRVLRGHCGSNIKNARNATPGQSRVLPSNPPGIRLEAAPGRIDDVAVARRAVCGIVVAEVS